MIVIKSDNKYVKSIGWQHIDWTDSVLDAFDLDAMPSDKEQEEYFNMIKAADPDAAVIFAKV